MSSPAVTDSDVVGGTTTQASADSASSPPFTAPASLPSLLPSPPPSSSSSLSSSAAAPAAPSTDLRGNSRCSSSGSSSSSRPANVVVRSVSGGGAGGAGGAASAGAVRYAESNPETTDTSVAGSKIGGAWGVYCCGPLLEAVQTANLFKDSKTFVDMPMKKDPAEVLAAFQALQASQALGGDGRSDAEKLRRFVSEYFDKEGSDIVEVVPQDFVKDPPFLASIQDPYRREWARSLHGLWAMLVRKGVDDVALHPSRHSLLPRRHPVVVPGGRFRESYYWDTFWTLRGLLVSGMVDTARGAVLNLLDDVDRFGFVPNGGRLYYTERSQPPLLSDMVCEVYSARPDRAFLARAIPSLEAEHAFWMDFERGRAVCVPSPSPPFKASTARYHPHSSEGAAVLLNRYWGALNPPVGVAGAMGGKDVGGPLPSRPPRPESYREDSLAESGQCACGRGSSSSGRGSSSGSGSGGCGGSNLAAAAAAKGAVQSQLPTVAGERGLDCGDEVGGEAAVGTGVRVGRPGVVEVNLGRAGACHELAAAAESGWDFSSRWAGISSRRGDEGRMAPPPFPVGEGEESGGKKKKRFCLCETATTSVVPVDLNCFLHRTELNVARLHHALDSCGGGSSSGSSGVGGDGSGYGRRSGGGGGRGKAFPPPLLTLDEIQRGFLLNRQQSTKGRWSWSSCFNLATTTTTTGNNNTNKGRDADSSAGGARTQAQALANASSNDKNSEGGDDDGGDVGDGDDGVAGGGYDDGSAVSPERLMRASSLSSSLPGGIGAGRWVEAAPAEVLLCRKALLFSAAARARARAMEQTMWDPKSALWRDLLLPTGEQSSSITPACFVPMWAGLPWPSLPGCGPDDANIGNGIAEDARLGRCAESLRKSGLVQPGGVCTSMEDSGQQWDGRNAWPPLQWMMIKGLRRSADAVITATDSSPNSTSGHTPQQETISLESAIASVSRGEGGRGGASAAAMATVTTTAGFSQRGSPEREAKASVPAPAVTAADEKRGGYPSALTTDASPSTVSSPRNATSHQSETAVAMDDIGIEEPVGAGGVTAARKLAAEIEEAFLRAACGGWERTGNMMEKYDAKEMGKGGGGGEYDVQEGFGWTNGVALDLMAAQSKQRSTPSSQTS